MIDGALLTSLGRPVRSGAEHCAALCVALMLLWASRGAVAAPGADKTLRVFIFAGQSNMVGADSRAEHIALYPPFEGLEQPQQAVKFTHCIGREDKARSDGWTELRPVNNTVGPELSFARRGSWCPRPRRRAVSRGVLRADLRILMMKFNVRVAIRGVGLLRVLRSRQASSLRSDGQGAPSSVRRQDHAQFQRHRLPSLRPHGTTRSCT